jgi:low affinity Fe/Cu permease
VRGSLPNQGLGAPKKARNHASGFVAFANLVANLSGKPATFLLAVVVVIVWGVTGPIFQYSDTWQLIINTGTTIVTFLMVFLIQNTQNRDTRALQIKLDELILATRDARNDFVAVEEESEEELNARHEEERARAQRARASRERSRRKSRKETA